MNSPAGSAAFRVERVKLSVYVITGFTAGIAALLSLGITAPAPRATARATN